MAEWRPVCGWPYEVSSEGQVRRIGCPVPLRAGLDKKPRYFKVVLHNAREGRNRTTFAVHSLVAEAFIGPCPKGLEVNHKDRDRGNNRADNLEYLTHLENVRHGPTPSGEHNYAAKLTSEQVMEVRSLYGQHHKPAALARRFNVDRQTIVDAIRGEELEASTWSAGTSRHGSANALQTRPPAQWNQYVSQYTGMESMPDLPERQTEGAAKTTETGAGEVMAASLFSQRLAVNVGADGDEEVERIVDAALQEVREVLASLSLQRSDGSRCFCEDGLYNRQHQANCLRARGLWAKLQIEEANQIQEQEKSNA